MYKVKITIALASSGGCNDINICKAVGLFLRHVKHSGEGKRMGNEI